MIYWFLLFAIWREFKHQNEVRGLVGSRSAASSATCSSTSSPSSTASGAHLLGRATPLLPIASVPLPPLLRWDHVTSIRLLVSVAHAGRRTTVKLSHWCHSFFCNAFLALAALSVNLVVPFLNYLEMVNYESPRLRLMHLLLTPSFLKMTKQNGLFSLVCLLTGRSTDSTSPN